MQSLWVLPYGPLLVDKQFVVDYNRLKLHFDNELMSMDIRVGVRRLYEVLGSQYYTYTRFMNQTMGNMGLQMLRNITIERHLIPVSSSFRVYGLSVPKRIGCTFRCDGLDSDLKKKNAYQLHVTFDPITYVVTLEAVVYKH